MPPCRRSSCCAAARLAQDVVEGAPELDVEDRVDERVEETVDVAEPDEQREQQRVEVAGDAGHAAQRVCRAQLEGLM